MAKAAPRGERGQAAARPAPLPLAAKMAGDEAGVTLGQPHLSRQDLATLVRRVRGAPARRRGVAAGRGASCGGRSAPRLATGRRRLEGREPSRRRAGVAAAGRRGGAPVGTGWVRG